MVFGFGVSPVGGFIVDFACPQLSFAIELDGSQHDEGRSLRSWPRRGTFGHEVLGNLDGVLDVIYAARWG